LAKGGDDGAAAGEDGVAALVFVILRARAQNDHQNKLGIAAADSYYPTSQASTS